MFYQYSYTTCFDHNFDYHQALNEYISRNQTHWIQYGSVLVNRLLCSEYTMGIYLQSYCMVKKAQKIYIHKVTNMVRKVQKVDSVLKDIWY
jgi:hypothetical protein